MNLFGVRLLGFSEENGRKLLLTVGFILAILVLRAAIVAGLRVITRAHRNERFVFWTRQGTAGMTALLILIALVSVWFDNPARLSSAAALVTAGLAFALQRVVTAFAGYVMILRGKTFSVGDRITMGKVRGDVIALGFFQTTIMEMGQPQEIEAQADPAIWVRARQYTGRVVTVSNDHIFEQPVYNYTRELPFLWEEIIIPIKYGTDYRNVERILLDCAGRVVDDIRAQAEPMREVLERKYFIRVDEMGPRVYCRLTSNWIELSLRFVVREHGIREVKDQLAREILDALVREGIEIASTTFEVVGLPAVQVARAHAQSADRAMAPSAEPHANGSSHRGH